MRNKGYILLEAFFALIVVTGVVLVTIDQITFMLKYEHDAMNRLYLYRSLYEESAIYCRFKEGPAHFQQGKYHYSFYEETDLVLKVEIHDKEESVSIERK